MNDWFNFTNAGDVASPALLLYPERIRENVRRMLQIVGGVARLRPHVKTHKLAELVQMQLREGIDKFKCATVAEAEMAARAGAKDVVIAYPIVGPNAARLLELVRGFPATYFSCLADDPAAIRSLGQTFAQGARPLEVLLDIDCGQHRTGIEPGSRAADLYRLIASTSGLAPGGLHVYDGHIHEGDPVRRRAFCAAAFVPVEALRQELLAGGLSVPRVVAGGTPTFPIHARNLSYECSPGTCVLWDFGYAEKFADLNFAFGALVLTRIVSRPGANRLCLDLGHKAIAAENPAPRVKFLNLPDATEISHSEEHLVVESAQAKEFKVGDCLFGVPRHICPTVALYSEAAIIEKGCASAFWQIARTRRLTI